MLIDIYPEKAQYLEDEPVKLVMEWADGGESGETGELPESPGFDIELSVRHLAARVYSANRRIMTAGPSEKPAGTISRQIEIDLPPLPAGGYGIQARAGSRGIWSGLLSTAVSVVSRSSAKRIIRYGFLCDFGDDDLDDQDIRWLRQYHINTIQYYDWSYRPHQLVGPAASYQDLMGKWINPAIVKSKIASARKLGMRSLAYGAVYAAANDFLAGHPDWGLVDHAGRSIRFIESFCIMDISRACPWHEHIIGQYRQAISLMGFDGIHMDTYGHPKWAVSPANQGQTIYLEEHFSDLIDDARSALAADEPDVTLIFNNVGNWPVERTANAGQDCVYIEVWPPYERYHQISQLITDGKRFSSGKPVVLAAYLAPFRTGIAAGAHYAALILTAVIFGHGATHLLLGENGGVLTQGYYVDHSTLTIWQAQALRKYYDFAVQYQDLLYDDNLIDVSMTHSSWDNVEFNCLNTPWSPCSEAGKLSLTCRLKPGWRTISLVNLCGSADDYWNQDKPCPSPLEQIVFEVQLDGHCRDVWLASPDDHGQPVSLPFQEYAAAKGLFVRIVVPKIEIWSLLVINCQEAVEIAGEDDR